MAVKFRLFKCVGQRQGQYAAHRVCDTGLHQALNQFRGDQAASRVVHQHPILCLGTQ